MEEHYIISKILHSGKFYCVFLLQNYPERNSPCSYKSAREVRIYVPGRTDTALRKHASPL